MITLVGWGGGGKGVFADIYSITDFKHHCRFYQIMINLKANKVNVVRYCIFFRIFKFYDFFLIYFTF